MNDQLDCALDLMRRLPPQQITKNLCDLVDLVLLENVVLVLTQRVLQYISRLST